MADELAASSNTPMIIIGTTKPLMSYVTALITVFNRGSGIVCVRARGQAINMMVEAIQLLRSRFMNDVYISEAKVDGDTIHTPDGRRLNLPVLEVTLARRLQ